MLARLQRTRAGQRRMSILRKSHPIRDSACVPDPVRLGLPALRAWERALYADVPMYSCSGMTITCPICAVASVRSVIGRSVGAAAAGG